MRTVQASAKMSIKLRRDSHYMYMYL